MRYILLLAALLFIVLPLASAATLFFDGFESGTPIQNGWNLRSISAAQNWTNSKVNPFQGLRHAQSRPLSTTVPASVMWINVSTVGYTNVSVSYFVRRVGLDGPDEFNVTWHNGTVWVMLEQTGSSSANDAAYVMRNWSLGVAASNKLNLTIRFECTAGAATEFCRIDNFNITGNVLTDSTPPLVSFITPTEANESILLRSFILINVTGNDTNLDRLTVRLFNSSHSLLFTNLSSSSPFFVNYSGLSDGRYYFNASANDSAGNVNHTETRTVLIDALAPGLAIVSPLHGNYTNALILINISTSGAASVWFNNGTGNTTYITELYQTFGQESNLLIAYANDSVGNLNTTNVTFFIDSLVPHISFGAGTSASGSSGVLSLIYVDISASDANEQNIVFSLFNATSLVDRSQFGAGARAINWTNLANGVYFYNVTINDTLGNANWTETRNHTVDNVAPLVDALVPVADTTFALNGSIEIGVNVSDAHSFVSSVIASLAYPNGTFVNLSLENVQGVKYNATFVVPYLFGRYNVSFYANDSLGNVNTTQTTFFTGADVTAPRYSNASQTPVSPTTYAPFRNYTFNITWTDEVALNSVLFEFNSINYTMALQGSSVYSITFFDLAAGTYAYRYLANDSAGNWNSTSLDTYIISKSVPNLSFLLNGTESNLSLMYGDGVNASALSATNTVQLYRNGVNVTSENHLFVTLAVGQYNYTATAFENQNYSLLNLTRSVFISPAIGAVTLLLNSSASNQTGFYGVLTNASASTPYGVVTLYRDGVDVTGANHHLMQLASGDYNWTAVSSGNENYSSSSIALWSHIARAQGNVTLLLNGSAENLTISYPGQVNASATSATGGIQLYRNGVNMTNENHQFVGLAVGQYNYTAFALESQNYTNASTLVRATIIGVVPDLNISITPSSNVVYPTATTALGIGCVDELTCVLYRNHAFVSNPDSATLGAGTYMYVYNTTGNENYSSASFSRILIVNQSTGLVYAYVNHARANITIELGQSINLNATLIKGSGSIALVLNGEIINNGSSPLSNLTLFSTPGLFNMTASYMGNENYSFASETWFVSVASDTSAPSFSSFVEDPNNATSYVAGQSYRFNVTVTENYMLDRVGIEFNGVNYSVRNVSAVFTFNVADLAAGIYSYYWWANDTRGNYNISEIRYYILVPASGSSGLLLNGLASNLSVPYLVPTNLSATTSHGSVTLLLDGADITSQNHLNVTRGAGFYNVTSFSSEDQNHSSASVTYWLNITRLASNVSLFLNHTRANISIVRGTLLPINGSIDTGENGLSVWVDSTLIYSGASPSYNLTNFTSIGLVNVSAFYAQSQNYSASSETRFVNVTYLPLLELVCEAGGPYQSNATVVSAGNVTFQGAALSSQLVVLELRNTTGGVYMRNVISASDGGFEGIFEWVPVGLYVFNASSSYLGQNVSCIDGVQVGGPAQIVLDKTVDLYSVSNDTIIYNVSLRVLNVGASSALVVNLSDANSSESPYDLGTLAAGSYTDRSYLLNFTRGSTDSFALLSQAFAYGIDSYSGAPLQVNSTIFTISVPGFSVGKHVILIKNIVYLAETNRNVTYNVSTLLYNSGEENLVNLVYLDADINLTSFVINLSRASSVTYSNLVVIAKAASNQQHTFALATATSDALTFYGNQPIVTIPGYGGPADSIVYAPVRVAPLASFDTVIEVRNMNPDIGQDFQVDYWITSSDERVNFSSGAQTIYVPALGSANTTVNLVAPATSAIYRLRALVSWAGGTATAFDSFEAASEDDGGSRGSGGGGGSTLPVTGAAVTPRVLPSEGEFSPEEVICTAPYIRHGRGCCLDRNNNSICDSDEISTGAPRRGFFTGLFTFNIDRIVVVRFIDNLLILLVSLAIVLFCITTVTRLIHRRRRDTTRLTHLMGAEVYTQHGVHIGKLIDINLENYRIHSIVVELRAKHRNKHKGIVVPYRFVKGIKDVVLIDELMLKQVG
ncbi:MAG: PRC-barrel domain-containing protein [Nanoarchaeota archaeon]